MSLTRRELLWACVSLNEYHDLSLVYHNLRRQRATHRVNGARCLTYTALSLRRLSLAQCGRWNCLSGRMW